MAAETTKVSADDPVTCCVGANVEIDNEIPVLMEPLIVAQLLLPPPLAVGPKINEDDEGEDIADDVPDPEDEEGGEEEGGGGGRISVVLYHLK